MPKTQLASGFFGFQAESAKKSDGYRILATWCKNLQKDETQQVVLCPFFSGLVWVLPVLCEYGKMKIVLDFEKCQKYRVCKASPAVGQRKVVERPVYIRDL